MQTHIKKPASIAFEIYGSDNRNGKKNYFHFVKRGINEIELKVFECTHSNECICFDLDMAFK